MNAEAIFYFKEYIKRLNLITHVTSVSHLKIDGETLLLPKELGALFPEGTPGVTKRTVIEPSHPYYEDYINEITLLKTFISSFANPGIIEPNYRSTRIYKWVERTYKARDKFWKDPSTPDTFYTYFIGLSMFDAPWLGDPMNGTIFSTNKIGDTRHNFVSKLKTELNFPDKNFDVSSDILKKLISE